MDSLYELKKELYEIVINKEMPLEVQLLSNMTKRELKRILENYHVLDANKEQYIETQFETIKPYIKRIQETKNSQDFEQISTVISQIGLKIEEVSENAKAFDKEEMADKQFLGKSEQKISLINTKEGNTKAVKDVILVDINVLEDIRNSVNRTAEIDESKKEELNYAISQLKHHIESQIPQELLEAFARDDKKLLQEVSQKFEKYYYIEKNQKENPFKKELDAGISLEQQSENAKVFMDQQNEEKNNKKPKALPDNVIE